MASEDRGRPLPKFGEWDVNDPASAEGFTVIFSKARDEKKGGAAASAAGNGPSHANTTNKPDNNTPALIGCRVMPPLMMMMDATKEHEFLIKDGD